METKICSKCGLKKEVCEFNKRNVSKNGTQYYKSRCKICQSEDGKVIRNKNPEKYKLWYDKNREERNIYRSKYYELNKEKIKNYNKKFQKTRNIKKRKDYHSDPIVKLRHRLSCRLREVLKFKSLDKKQTMIGILGCSPDFLKKHLEKQFTENMSWGNHGFYGWHIDHIIPLSSAQTEEDVYKLCHYTNLQPLWAEENLKKGDRF